MTGRGTASSARRELVVGATRLPSRTAVPGRGWEHVGDLFKVLARLDVPGRRADHRKAVATARAAAPRRARSMARAGCCHHAMRVIHGPVLTDAGFAGDSAFQAPVGDQPHQGDAGVDGHIGPVIDEGQPDARRVRRRQFPFNVAADAVATTDRVPWSRMMAFCSP